MSKPNMIVRVEKSGPFKGDIIGVFADDTERNGDFPAVVLHSEHMTIDPQWYKNNTRPATPEEEARFCAWYEPNYSQINLKKRRSASK